MSFGPCPTVKVCSDTAPGGFVVINESDLTQEHELFPKAAPVAKEPAKPTLSLKPKA